MSCSWRSCTLRAHCVSVPGATSCAHVRRPRWRRLWVSDLLPVWMRHKLVDGCRQLVYFATRSASRFSPLSTHFHWFIGDYWTHAVNWKLNSPIPFPTLPRGRRVVTPDNCTQLCMKNLPKYIIWRQYWRWLCWWHGRLTNPAGFWVRYNIVTYLLTYTTTVSESGRRAATCHCESDAFTQARLCRLYLSDFNREMVKVVGVSTGPKAMLGLSSHNADQMVLPVEMLCKFNETVRK